MSGTVCQFHDGGGQKLTASPRILSATRFLWHSFGTVACAKKRALRNLFSLKELRRAIANQRRGGETLTRVRPTSFVWPKTNISSSFRHFKTIPPLTWSPNVRLKTPQKRHKTFRSARIVARAAKVNFLIRHVCTEGYRRWKLMRASAVVWRQSTRRRCWLRCCSPATASRCKVARPSIRSASPVQCERCATQERRSGPSAGAVAGKTRADSAEIADRSRGDSTVHTTSLDSAQDFHRTAVSYFRRAMLA
jgi:hypothetical protein